MRKLLVLLLLSAPVLSAPAPAPRASPPPPSLTESYLVGTWRLHWNSTPSFITYLPNGRLHYRIMCDAIPSNCSQGEWKMSKDGVKIVEWYMADGLYPDESGSPTEYFTKISPTGPNSLDGVWIMSTGAVIRFKAVRIGGK